MPLAERQDRWRSMWATLAPCSPAAWGRAFIASLLRATAINAIPPRPGRGGISLVPEHAPRPAIGSELLLVEREPRRSALLVTPEPLPLN
jgi:hypothetical protein